MKELNSPDIDGVFTQEDIESKFTLLGASCVEDLLQEDVSRCLIDFKRAGIQTWMLTGDKGKTAKMIGVQCGMFTPDLKHSDDVKDESRSIENVIAEEQKSTSNVSFKQLKMNSVSIYEEEKIIPRTNDKVILHEVDADSPNIESEIKMILALAAQKGDKKLELLVDGCAFAKMLNTDRETLSQMNEAFNAAAAVIIYRASPKQKEQVVQFIRTHNPGKVTLSVGDGSNDVNMI